MDLFDFDFHNFETEYPDSGNRMQLGNSYTFSSSPVAPDQRIITLSFKGMLSYHNADGSPDPDKNPRVNIWRLEQFYLANKLWRPFNYKHARYGVLVVKFNKPFKVPKMVEGEIGLTESFTVEFQEQP